ncbi:MAG: hypothetical protein A3E25_05180 [Burkholderiales bacterium RIFCSPHIGHO2_12_FULL_69_20]|nr:MAG: hypothetical protein A3E25_05180 [Burkholderiales bacterium RIFCSPHIGHO2_12_FULL_69_20]
MVHRMHFKASMALLIAAGFVLGAVPDTRAQAADGPVLRVTAGPAPSVLGDTPTQAASNQIKTLEQQVQVVLAEARRQQEQAAQMRERLAAAEAASAWLPWLVLGLVLIGGLAVWMSLRVRRLQQAQQRGQRQAVDTDSRSALVPAGAAMSRRPLLSTDRPLLAPSDEPPAGTASTPSSKTVAHTRVMALSPADGDATASSRHFSLGTGVPPRPVSVEELLDLEQQVEFFLVLGQEQAAIDLLLSHVRGTGGTSALPYFKLLEIYRQLGDEEAYERTRERFNQRFNAFAPDWSGDLAGGRSLEDYAEVMARLQRAWAQPMRAVAELESLLLRRADLEPFDLPAYREVLMLHALVLDLPAAPLAGAQVAGAPVASPTIELLPPPPQPAPPARAGESVDLLLPLGEGPLEITSPRPHLSERTSAQAMLAEWVFTRATAPLSPFAAPAPLTALDDEVMGWGERPLDAVSRPGLLDLDLTDYAPAPREFTRPAAFTDIDMRRDSRLSDLAFDAPDSDSPALPSRL